MKQTPEEKKAMAYMNAGILRMFQQLHLTRMMYEKLKPARSAKKRQLQYAGCHLAACIVAPLPPLPPFPAPKQKTKGGSREN